MIVVHAGISMAMAMAVSMPMSVGLSVRLAMATSFTTHPVALHGAAFSVTRAPRLCLGLNLVLAAPTRPGLCVAQLLGTPFDFGHARRVGAFTNAALGSLRECSRGRKQQRQHGDGYTVHFHDDLSLTGDGLLSDKSANWFL